MKEVIKRLRHLLSILLIIIFNYSTQANRAGNEYNWDIRPFGELTFWSDSTGVLGKTINQDGLIDVPQSAESEWNMGVWWKEERDIDHIEVEYKGKLPESLIKNTKVQYWHQTWPGAAPKEHTIEDPMDDPWQGKWVTAETEYQINGNKVVYYFKPMKTNENRLAANLPGDVNYRRTLKIRLVYNSKPLPVQSFRIISPTVPKKMSLKISFGCDRPVSKPVEGRLDIFNGKIERISGWNWNAGDRLTSKNGWRFQPGKQSKGIKADLITAAPELAGSNDITVVTVRSSEGNFSFSVNDLDKGAIYIPAYSAYITLASDTAKFDLSVIKKGQTIRENLKTEPEQTYERACREIPKLNVMLREDGGKLYLPLASDASWQKFALEWGGGFFMNKRSTKAKGKELARCNWKGNELHWYIGTGQEPVYIRDDKTSHMSILNDYLPVPQVMWNHEGLNYHEEAFATQLEGPLSAYDPKRDEQTPSILMLKLTVSNPTLENKSTHIRLKAEALENPSLQDLFIMDKVNGDNYIRAKLKLPQEVKSSDIKLIQNAVDIPVSIPAGKSVSLYLSTPFVGDLTDNSKDKISSLDYATERQRVISYWRDIVDQFTAFNVPEPKFNEMARSVITHIRMSTTKDPKTGLYMVPAASFGYQVYANESAFQIIYLDKIGDHETAEKYLETFLKLQGTDPMPGTFTGDQSAVFHGGKVDKEYNYTSGPYNLDHGTVLWALGQHYLMTGNKEWLKHAYPNMLKAAEWIIEQRNQTKLKDKDGNAVLHYGLMPAGRLEDNADWGFWFAVNAYSCLGLKATAEAFKRAGLAEAERLEKEAADYMNDLKNGS